MAKGAGASTGEEGRVRHMAETVGEFSSPELTSVLTVVSLVVNDKVTRQCPQTTTFEEKGEPKRIRTKESRKLTRSRRAEDTIPKKRLLQLIKTAYLPGCTERTIEQLNRLDVNEKVSSSGLTYFLCACLSGAEDLIKYMIRIGANVNEETCEGDSALYLATYAVLHSVEPSIDALRVLIKAGCSVNKQNGRGYTPLHRAASKGSLKVIQYLLLEGADPYIANNAGVYPIDSAVCAGHTEAAQLLKLKFPSPYVWDVVEPHTPLHIRMGLQSPQRKLTLQSSKRLKLRNVFT